MDGSVNSADKFSVEHLYDALNEAQREQDDEVVIAVPPALYDEAKRQGYSDEDMALATGLLYAHTGKLKVIRQEPLPTYGVAVGG